MLDFRVETFLAVCRHMNFTKAARELNITQPAVSHHMHYLEQAYGTALFQHNGKRLQLTEAGEILRRTLMTMKHDEQHLQKRMQQVVSGTRDYSFGATLSVAEFMINEALGRFLRLHPDSHIQMQVADTKVLLSKLDSGELDFAVVEGDFPKAEYDFFVFGTEEYVAAGDPEKAARYRGRPLTDLLGEPLLLREEGSGTRVILEYYLKEYVAWRRRILPARSRSATSARSRLCSKAATACRFLPRGHPPGGGGGRARRDRTERL
ncbi:MAG: LysR family transcriptional regulator [Oscillospiraceae bacterium]